MRANAQVPSRRKRNSTERVRATLRARKLPREHFASVRTNKNVSNASEDNLWRVRVERVFRVSTHGDDVPVRDEYPRGGSRDAVVRKRLALDDETD